MSIYNINGQSLSSCYNKSGTESIQAFDVDGVKIFDKSTPSNTFNVMTFNIQRWGGLNSNTTVLNSIFSAYTPLICGVQETGSSGTLNYIGTQFQSGKAMTSIPNNPAFLFNTSYTGYEDAQYATQSGETRGYQKCYIEVDGKQIAVFNTHIAAKGATATAQIRELFELLQEETYFIALGDFNVECHSTQDSEYTNVVKQFIDAGYNLSNWTAETGFVDTWFNGSTVEGSTWVCPCDNIITSPNIDIEYIWYDQRKIEANTGQTLDHIPVVSRLTVT